MKPKKPIPTLPPQPIAAKSISQQAKFYDVVPRTIVTWRKRGAPLRYPSQMIAWWSRANPNSRPNPGIVAALREPTGAPTVAQRPTSPALDHPESLADPHAPPLEVGFDATHQRMLVEEARLYARIQRIEAEGEEQRAAGDLAGADRCQTKADLLRPGWVRLAASLGQADS